MRLLLTFIIFILGGFYTFGKENCCEQCCEYLENCCNKGKENKKKEEEEEVPEEEDNGEENKEKNKNKEEEEELPEEFYLKKSEATDSKEIEKLVSSNWYKAKKETALFILYEKINVGENQNLNENGVIKVKKIRMDLALREILSQKKIIMNKSGLYLR